VAISQLYNMVISMLASWVEFNY